jgi:hypothetical protein
MDFLSVRNVQRQVPVPAECLSGATVAILFSLELSINRFCYCKSIANDVCFFELTTHLNG